MSFDTNTKFNFTRLLLTLVKLLHKLYDIRERK